MFSDRHTNLFYKRLSYNASRHSDAIVFVFHHANGCQNINWLQLLSDIDNRIKEIESVPDKSLVFIISATEYNGIIDYLASLCIGLIPAFIAPPSPRQDPGLYSHELDILINKFSPAFIVREGIWEKSKLKYSSISLISGADGFLQFSSGTTQLKKGVFIGFTKLFSQLDALGQAIGISKTDRIASWLPLYHDMGLISGFFLPLYFGIRVDYLHPITWSYKPNLLLEIIQQEQSTLCWQPNFAFSHILNYYSKSGQPVPDMSSLRLMINCSEVCKYSSFFNFESFFIPHGLGSGVLQCCYAMAENVFAVTQTSFTGSVPEMPVYQDTLSSGSVLEGNLIRVVNTDDGAGEIQISSKTMFEAYILDDSAKFTDDGWYRTGDLGVIIENHLFVVGRIDDVVIINGRKIQAHYIEALVSEHPNVKSGRVLVTGNSVNSGLCVFYEGEGLTTQDQRTISIQVHSSSSVSIDRFVHLPPATLVKSTSGKISRKKSLIKLESLSFL